MISHEQKCQREINQASIKLLKDGSWEHDNFTLADVVSHRGTDRPVDCFCDLYISFSIGHWRFILANKIKADERAY